MSSDMKKHITEICKQYQKDRTRLMDIVAAVQRKYRHVSNAAMGLIADELGIHLVEVRGLVSFYAFFSEQPKGEIIIRVCNDVVDRMKGADAVAQEFSRELGIGAGETSKDGKYSLEYTPCIGMCDQAPAVLINDIVHTNVTASQVKGIIDELKKNGDPKKLVTALGDGNNAHLSVRAMVRNNIQKKGPVIFADHEAECGLKKAIEASPEAVLRLVKMSKLRGRGGAGFPAGMKWEFTRAAKGDRKFIICNADEGEPGTFKDRVLLTEKCDLLFEGMTIAAYAIGANEGLMYLRAEYAYLRDFLDQKLAERRTKGLLGKSILKSEFDFDIHIQMGAGAYICGEESALISSCEGLRGDPKTRPPFPAQKGYLGCPTSVNNVETLCCVPRILEKGASWFATIGTTQSSGTKLLSVSGDCERPGVYEWPFGIKLTELLKQVGAEDAQSVLVGGPSGSFIGPNDYDHKICFEDLATGGAVVIFGPQRDLLKIVQQYMEFFIEESCGYCTPCRAGNVILKNRLDQIIAGRGETADLLYLKELGKTIKKTSRCGLGQTSPNPILTTIKNFRSIYEDKMVRQKKGMQPSFDIHAALADAKRLTGRDSVIFTE